MPRRTPTTSSSRPVTRGSLAIVLPALLAACGPKEPPPIRFEAPRVVETARLRCPAPSDADRRLFASEVADPVHWRTSGAKRRELQAQIDRLTTAVLERNRAGQRAHAELDKCRGDGVDLG